MQIVRFAAALSAAMVFVSCAATQKSVGGWFEAPTPTPSPTPKPAPAAKAPRAYYAAVEGLKVHIDPSASSKVVGTLSLHEKVTRLKVERGYALVASTKSGVRGWVDNAQLSWRLPTSPTTAAPAPGETEPEEAAAPAVEEPQEPAAAEGTATKPMPAATSAPTAPASSFPTARPVGPSIFNPY
jgi:SH3 domain-containing protein